MLLSCFIFATVFVVIVTIGVFILLKIENNEKWIFALIPYGIVVITLITYAIMSSVSN